MKKRKMSDQVGLKIEKFSGEKNDWKLWAELFKARLLTKGLLDIINVKPEEIPNKDANVEEKGVKELLEQNSKAYLELIGAMNMKHTKGRMAINLVIATKTEKYPNGNCAKAWQNLMRKFEPKTSAERARVKKAYVNAKLKFGSDPDSFVDYLERLREELSNMSEVISDRTFLSDLISKLNNGYDNVIERMHDMIDEADSDDDVDVDLIRDRLRARYERLRATKGGPDKPKRVNKQRKKRNGDSEDSDDDSDNEGDEDQALVGYGAFKGMCY